jgi:predicted GIY-YIG superfamily endonuclease
MTEQFYAYLLRCSDSSYYAGHTDDIEARLFMHRSGVLKGYTHSRRPVQLVWCETFPIRDEAFESGQIKGWSRAKKDAFVARNWDEIVRLARQRASDRTLEKLDAAKVIAESSAHPSRASG